VGHEEGEFVVRSAFERPLQIVCSIKVGVVGPCQEKGLIVSVNMDGLIDEKDQALRLKKGRHFDKIMISQDPDNALRTGNGLHDPSKECHAPLMFTIGLESKITGHDAEVVL
jgi:hypothetical protein